MCIRDRYHTDAKNKINSSTFLTYIIDIDDVKNKIASGEQPVFDSVDALFEKLEAD